MPGPLPFQENRNRSIFSVFLHLSVVAPLATAFDHLEQDHASDHRNNVDHTFRLTSTYSNNTGSGAEACEAPADTEYQAAYNQSCRNFVFGWQAHVETQKRCASLPGNGESKNADSYGAGHDQRKRGVPGACQVKKAEYLLGVGQP